MNFKNCFCGSRKPCISYSYAQYSVLPNAASNSNLSMSALFQEGNHISLKSPTEILLEPGYLYLVDFIFLASPEADSFMQITPRINGALKLLYSFFAPAGAVSRNTSASGSFTIPVTETASTVSFNLAYPDTVKNIDITGAVSVTALHEISAGRCKCSAVS